MKNEKGFTLAEVLITLAIIGVVAALTIPTLMANYQKTQYVAQLKQVYSQLSQNIKLLMVDENVDNITDCDILNMKDDWSDFDETLQRGGEFFLKKYFKIVKDCGMANPNPCLAEAYTSLDGGSSGTPYPGYCVITTSGATICLHQPEERVGLAISS